MKAFILLGCLVICCVSQMCAQTLPWVDAYYPGYYQNVMPPDKIYWPAVTNIMHHSVFPDENNSYQLNANDNGLDPNRCSAILQAADQAGKKVILVLGGVGIPISRSFYVLADSAPLRVAFISQVITFMKRYGHSGDQTLQYAGVDLDWENFDDLKKRENGSHDSVSVANHYDTLITSLRSALDSTFGTTPRKLLTSAVGVTKNPAYLSKYDSLLLLGKIDHLNLMTYDLAGPWGGYKVWHNSAVNTVSWVSPPSNLVLSADDAAQQCLAKTYIHDHPGYLGIGGSCNGALWPVPYGTFLDSVTTTGNISVVPYKDIVKPLAAGGYYDQSKFVWNDNDKGAYVKQIGSGNQQLVSYDNQLSMKAKWNYITTNNLGGLILWDITGAYRGDDTSLHAPAFPDSILRSVDAARSPRTVAETAKVNWNMLSVPLFQSNNAFSTLFPSLHAGPFGWENGHYVSAGPTAQSGRGYWFRYDQISIPPANVDGGTITRLKVPVVPGWNLIGSLSDPLDTSKIYAEPYTPSDTTPRRVGTYFKYTPLAGYSTVGVLSPGIAHWIKWDADGYIVLDSASSQHAQEGTGVSPPSAAAPVALLSPSNYASGLDSVLTLSWDSPEANDHYELQIFNGTETLIYDSTALTSLSKQVTLHRSSTYFWQVRAFNSSNQSGPWSALWSFSTRSYSSGGGGGEPCAGMIPVSDVPDLDQFHILAADGNEGQLLYVRNGSRGIKGKLLLSEEMPPDPAPTVFHARFGSGKMIEHVPAPGKAAYAQGAVKGAARLDMGKIPAPKKELPILLKDARYPLQFRWSLKPGNRLLYSLVLTGGGDAEGRQKGKTIIPLTDESGSFLINDKGGRLSLLAEAIMPTQEDPPCEIERAHALLPQKDVESSIPEQYGLEQNYPNPFNPTTEVRYELPEDADVSLVLYNTLGQAVRTVINERQSAGYKTVPLDMSGLSSGVYFYRLTAGKFTEVKKMLLMR